MAAVGKFGPSVEATAVADRASDVSNRVAGVSKGVAGAAELVAVASGGKIIDIERNAVAIVRRPVESAARAVAVGSP